MESLSVWVVASMVAAWLHVGKIVGITPKDVADAISKGSIEKPLYEGSDGARQTAALLSAVGVFEGGYDNKAKGDCKNRPPGWPGCGKTDDSQPTSFCFLQVHFGEVNGVRVERVKGYTPEELMVDPINCVRAAREIMRDSLLEHKKRIKENPDAVSEPLLQYAGTGIQARRRFELAQKLFKEVPFSIRCD